MRDRLAALFFLLGGGLYLLGALAFPLGTVARPGAGFFPLAVGVFVCVVAAVGLAVGLVVARRRPAPVSGPREGSALAGGAARRVAATGGGLVGFCLLLPWAGYPVSAFLFVAMLLKSLGGGRWLGILIAAALSAALSYYLFAVLLGVPLPRGVLFDR